MFTRLNSSQRISDFVGHVNRHQEEIRTAGTEAWVRAPTTGEVAIIQKFLSDPQCGSAYLNRELAPVLSQNGWVVKFASVFVHQMPMVVGWTEQGGARKKLSGRCELGDLQTLFVYLAADKTVCQIRSVVFQAKLAPATGDYVIENKIQRQLYDECDGFTYETVCSGERRQFPSGTDRARALQYLFVQERPVQARTIPARASEGAFVEFGEHLLRFLNDATGLEVRTHATKGKDWHHLVWDMIEYVANQVTTAGVTRNEGLRNLLDCFNSFEDHRISYLGPNEAREGGFGLQLVIVWDGELDAQAVELAGWKARYPLLAWAEMRYRDNARKLSTKGTFSPLPNQRWLEDGRAILGLLARPFSLDSVRVILSALVYLSEQHRLTFEEIQKAVALVRDRADASEPSFAPLIKVLQNNAEQYYRIAVEQQEMNLEILE